MVPIYSYRLWVLSRVNGSLLTILLFTGIAFGQKLNFVNYSVEQGLAQSQVQQITQDSFGRLWIATWGGISKFDGRTFTNYYKSSGLNSQIVYCIYYQENIGIWIGNHNGLQLYDGRKFEVFNADVNTSDRAVIDLLSSSSDTIYALNSSGRLHLIQNDSLIESRQFRAHKFSHLSIDNCGNAYGASTHGVYNLSDNSKLFVDNKDIGSQIRVNKFYFDNNNDLLALTNKGLYKKKGEEYSRLLSYTDTDLGFTSIVQDSEHNIWVGTTKGAYRIDTNGSVEHIGAESGLTDNTINDIMVDREKNLWFASDAEGIFKLPPNAMERFDTSNGLPGNVVMGIAKDHNGIIWVGTLDGGLSKYENGTFENIRLPSDEAGAHKINSVYFGSKKKLWIGTLGGGLWIKENNKFKRIHTSEGIALNSVISISEDSSNTVWVTTPAGVYYYLDESLRKIDGINDACFSVLEKSKDTLLVGTTGGLFQIIHKSRAIRTELEDHDLGTVNCLLKMDDSILLGTEDDGIFIWNPTKKSVAQCASENGLPSDFIFSMHPLDSNTVLAGTGKGISAIYFTPESDNYVTRNFTTSFNPYGPECNLNAILNIGSDRFWVGTTKGIYCFNFNNAITAETPPLVYLGAVSLFSNDIGEGQIKDTLNSWTLIPTNLTLPYDQNHLTFDINGVALSHPDGLRYRYKLVGADSVYSKPITTSKVIYPNLAPGKYRFKAFALTRDNLRSSNEIDFPFIIKSSFYQTTWFMILMTGLLISLGYFLQNIRSNYKRMRLASNNRIRLEEQKKILEHTSEDLHDDLGNKITRISVLTDVLERKLEKGDIEKRKLINQIRENAQALYIGTKDIIWSLTPGTDNLFDLLEKCRLTGVHLFADTEIEFETKGISPSFSDVPLPFPVIRNLSMVVKEAFTNILRHSGASKAMMRVQFVSQHTFQIEITDNGRGQDTPLNISGHGVLNMHTRMDRIGGTITVGNGTDGGFKIVLSIKIPLKEG